MGLGLGLGLEVRGAHALGGRASVVQQRGGAEGHVVGQQVGVRLPECG